ncbi:unnamed protein product [Sphagnum balticum]
MLRSRIASVGSASPYWNEDLLFVVAEPFDDLLHLIVQDRVGNNEEILGQIQIPLSSIEHRIDARPVSSRWYILEKDGGGKGGGGVLGRIHVRLVFDGGYHVMDESANYISCARPTAKRLWKRPVGVLELGIHGANNLLPMKMTRDNRGSTDAYCIVKYGPKWIRTRTIFESFNPRWNEQYTLEVFDPCTVVTIGVFDNCHAHALPGDKMATAKDLPIGKVRIHLSTLESVHVYTSLYPLLVVTPHGVKKMGELELAVRLSCASTLNLMYADLPPQLPRMHFFHPLDPKHLEILQVAAMNIVALRLMRAEPPMRQEVVQFMLDTEAKADKQPEPPPRPNLMTVPEADFTVKETNPDLGKAVEVDTEAEHWSMRRSKANYYRIMAVLGGVLAVIVGFQVLKHRYERLRGVAGQIQNVLGELATMGEWVHSLLNWRDPRATAIFITFCLVTAILLNVTPFQVVAILLGVYILRHPRFRDPLPAVPFNFFKHLPSQSDRIL